MLLIVRYMLPCLLFLLTVTSAMADSCTFPGDRSTWHDFALHEFQVADRDCKVVCPESVAPGKPWIWRARFWGHEPQADLALLERGFHVVYMDVAGLFGSSQAVEYWNAFHTYLTRQHGFGDKPALEGMSRGGLIVYNWAAANPSKVACIYADAPVMDIKSWPGGLGEGPGSVPDWKRCLREYGLTQRNADTFKGNPLDHADVLANANIPLLHVVGATDKVVPVAENSAIMETRYRALGGDITVISKPDTGHHPHSLEDPKPIVDFILSHTATMDTNYFDPRSGLTNAGAMFTQTKRGRVAFMGGSITEMNGWRALTYEELERRFPDTIFDFIDAGIASTDSTLGSFRLEQEVFRNGPVDLLFVEFAVNDNHNSRTTQERIRGMEGIIRRARALNPNIDIIVQYFAEPSKIALYNEGVTPPEIVAHDAVTAHYNVPAINLALEVADALDRGDFSWEKDFKDLHPSPFGHRLYLNRISRLFDCAWAGKDLNAAAITPHALPDAPLDQFNYGRGKYVDIRSAKIVSGWSHIPSWNPTDKAGKRKQFINVPVLEAREPGAELQLEFEGTAIGLLVTAGPDAGILEYAIDGKSYPPLEQFTRWSPGLHIPWAYMLATELTPGKHTLTLRTASSQNEKSTGHAARIHQFLAK